MLQVVWILNIAAIIIKFANTDDLSLNLWGLALGLVVIALILLKSGISKLGNRGLDMQDTREDGDQAAISFVIRMKLNRALTLSWLNLMLLSTDPLQSWLFY